MTVVGSGPVASARGISKRATVRDSSSAPREATFRLPKSILLVEDNMMIALDTEETLLSLGVARVDTASSNDAALAIIDGAAPEFALLDFNLGGETSEPIARVLDQRGVPFAFATGYGEVEALTDEYAHSVCILQKPYSRDDLRRAMGQVDTP